MGYGWYKLIGGMREAKYVISPSSRTCIYNKARRQSTNTPRPRLLTQKTTISSPILTATSELGREKMWARINLIPLLQAEEDRDQVRRYLADQKREKELLGDNAKVYNSDRLVPSSRGSVDGEYANTGQIREADFRCYTPSYYKLNCGKTQACIYVFNKVALPRIERTTRKTLATPTVTASHSRSSLLSTPTASFPIPH